MGTVPPYVIEPDDAVTVTVTVTVGRVTFVVALELIGPYVLPLASVHRSDAVSVRSPAGWAAGTV